MIQRLMVLALALTLVLSGCSPAAFPNLSTPTRAGADGGYTPPFTETQPQVQPTTMENSTPAAGAPQGGARSLYPPPASDSGLVRGKLFVDSATILQKSDEPGMYNLFIEGSLPTPCHQPRAQVSAPDADKKIAVDVYSMVKADEICTQVLKPFNAAMAVLGGYPPGTYSVVVNGEAAGELTIP